MAGGYMGEDKETRSNKSAQEPMGNAYEPSMPLTLREVFHDPFK